MMRSRDRAEKQDSVKRMSRRRSLAGRARFLTLFGAADLRTVAAPPPAQIVGRAPARTGVPPSVAGFLWVEGIFRTLIEPASSLRAILCASR